jgi:hypothetical protein
MPTAPHRLPRKPHSLLRATPVLTVAVVIAVAACTGKSPSGVARVKALVVVSGDSQRAIPGAPLADSLTAMAEGPGGGPESGVPVNWSGTNGATVSPGTDTTNAAGFVRVRVTLGPTYGDFLIIASSPGYQPAHFGATAVVPGTPDLVSPVVTTARAGGPR